MVQPAGPFQMSGPQVESLVLKCRIGPDKPKRQEDLDGEDSDQRPRWDRHAALSRAARGWHVIAMVVDGGLRASRRRSLNRMPGCCELPGIPRRPSAGDQLQAPAAMASDRDPERMLSVGRVGEGIPAGLWLCRSPIGRTCLRLGGTRGVTLALPPATRTLYIRRHMLWRNSPGYRDIAYEKVQFITRARGLFTEVPGKLGQVAMGPAGQAAEVGKVYRVHCRACTNKRSLFDFAGVAHNDRVLLASGQRCR